MNVDFRLFLWLLCIVLWVVVVVLLFGYVGMMFWLCDLGFDYVGVFGGVFSLID